MFFGLTNSPATFQMMMNDIFQDLIAEGVNTTTSLTSSWNVSASTSSTSNWRSEFEQTQIKYLGLIILHEAVEMDPVKVAGMAEWLEPKNKKENFLHHACPLFAFTGKDIVWSWGPLEQVAFGTLKYAMTSGPILLFPNDNSLFRVEANSSDFATGAVLSQQSPEDGKWYPVAFYSKSLNTVEWNYKIHNKKMLAIIQLFEEWWHFLEGTQHKFEIWTDHKNLKYFQTAKKSNH
ncbi:hypothetical protein E4T56_gene3549 [Termitomyces sp. T112]|nr:hypothetical protein E4T56_gene3549 [Termitomyces sp. T112]